MSIPSIAWLGPMLISADVKTVGAFFFCFGSQTLEIKEE
jgi:hypothetical protein